MGPHYLNRFFTPKSVAIVGASEREESVGYRLLLNMQEAGFKGGLYPVNHKRETLLGLKAYPDLNSVPEDLDLVVIATPAPSVPSVVRQCGEKSVTSVIIISAGFGELGAEGKRLQQEVLDIAHRYNIRIIGPNCLGVARPSGQLNATFGDGTIKDGNLALLSQSAQSVRRFWIGLNLRILVFQPWYPWAVRRILISARYWIIWRPTAKLPVF